MTGSAVCILTAGQGSRMGPLGQVLNKALLPVRGKAIISHLIEIFDPQTQFIIGLGYAADQVRDYLTLMHPQAKISYVVVDNWAEPGSGPGHSLWCCRPALSGAFYFLPCDGLYRFIPSEMPTGNWVGISEVAVDDTPNYCNFRLDDGGGVTEVINKRRAEHCFAFSGVMHIRDTESFWSALDQTRSKGGEVEIVDGLAAFSTGHRLLGRNVAWRDLGGYDLYRSALSDEAKYDFSKTDEFLYFGDDRVIKFFADKKITERRVAKTTFNTSVFPKILGQRGGFYAYAFAPGRTLYEEITPDLFRIFLDWMKTKVWPARTQVSDISSLCLEFYKEKTAQRLKIYDRKYPDRQPLHVVNGREVPPLSELIAKVDWQYLARGVPAFIHGDLQFDNVLWDGTTFTLLDWRQDFAGSVEVGDLYYDFAKLLGGLILNYDYIKLGLLRYFETDGKADLDFARRWRCDELVAILKAHVESGGWDWDKVKLITSIIFLNMAPLHHPPFDRALIGLGTLYLQDALTKQG